MNEILDDIVRTLKTINPKQVEHYARLYLKKWLDFDSRASRKEYFFPALTLFIIYAILNTLNGFIPFIGILLILLPLAIFVPGLSCGVRRLHDIGRSGWWLLITFIPVFGTLILLYLMLQKGSSEINDFGSVPGDNI